MITGTKNCNALNITNAAIKYLRKIIKSDFPVTLKNATIDCTNSRKMITVTFQMCYKF